MDEAFVRRLHFAVDFPFPNEEERLRIWQKVWPKDTPRDPALDLALLAQRFQMTGGNIRNIAVASAFLAIDDSEIVSMSHIVRATQREYQKMGKVISAAEFGLPGSEILARRDNGCPTFPQRHERQKLKRLHDCRLNNTRTAGYCYESVRFQYYAVFMWVSLAGS